MQGESSSNANVKALAAGVLFLVALVRLFFSLSSFLAPRPAIHLGEVHFEEMPPAPQMEWQVSEGPLVLIDDVPMDYVDAARLLLRDPVTAQRIEPIDPNFTNGQVQQLLDMGALKGLAVTGTK